MRFKCLDSKALILKSRKELVTSLVAAAVVTAAGFAIGSASLASAQDLSRRPSTAEAAFVKENDAAMTKMMNDMAVKPTGDVDHDFGATRAPQHHGAIDMPRAELRYGGEVQLRRIAQEIVVDQIQQISLMRLAVGEPLPPSVSSPTDPTPQSLAGQAPFDQPDIPISSHDRVYTADQFSNTVSVVDPSSNTLLGVIRLGDPSPNNFTPLARLQAQVHGMVFSPDHRTIAVVSLGSNSVAFIDTATN